MKLLQQEKQNTNSDISGTKQRVSLAPLDILINKAWGANPLPFLGQILSPASVRVC